MGNLLVLVLMVESIMCVAGVVVKRCVTFACVMRFPRQGGTKALLGSSKPKQYCGASVALNMCNVHIA